MDFNLLNGLIHTQTVALLTLQIKYIMLL